MIRYIAKRLLQAIPLLFLITVLTFSLINLAPYDAIDSITTPKMTPQQIEQIKEAYGLNQPPVIQYVRWLEKILHGDFGYSLLTHQKIVDDLAVRLPNSFKLVFPSFLTAYLLSIGLGLFSGYYQGRWPDKLINSFCSLLIAVPSFWLALMSLYLFSHKLSWLPVMGMHSIGQEENLVDYLRHFLLPFITLTLAFLPGNIRYVRASTIGQMREDYVLVQRSFGATRHDILFRHVFKNVLLPIVTRLGMSLPVLVTGAVITETVFNWPGIGPYFIGAVRGLDYPVIMSVLLLSSSLVILGNLLSDVLYGWIDPRIEEAR